MRRYTTVEKYIDIDVDMEDFEDDDLIEELERRGHDMSYTNGESGELIDKIYHARRQGKPYEHLLDQYLYMMSGRAI